MGILFLLNLLILVAFPHSAQAVTIKSISVASAIAIGSNYQGGIVFYINETGSPQGNILQSTSTVKHGLIAAPADINVSYTDAWSYSSSTLYRWSTGQTATVNTTDYYAYQLFSTSTGIGSGEANTIAILTKWPSATYPCSAAAVARAYQGGGYSDWFLPSKDELNKLYLVKNTVFGFVGSGYWSSSESSANHALGQDFGDGVQYHYVKFFNWRVRPVRAF